jgi:hypothetical protein
MVRLDEKDKRATQSPPGSDFSEHGNALADDLAAYAPMSRAKEVYVTSFRSGSEAQVSKARCGLWSRRGGSSITGTASDGSVKRNPSVVRRPDFFLRAVTLSRETRLQHVSDGRFLARARTEPRSPQ